MRALRRLEKVTGAAALCDIEKPEIGPDEVLLQVSYCGICGSDLHAYLNHPGYDFVLPQVTFGHELSGTVAASNAAEWTEGMPATMIALQGCLQADCTPCSEKYPQLCPKRQVQGFHFDGGMAEYIAVHKNYLIPLPLELDLKAASLTEPLSVACHCVQDCSSIQDGDRVIVTGPGIIGMLCALVARHMGADVIIVGTEADEAVRLSAAQKIGFKTATVGKDDLTNYNADVLIEASGAAVAFSNAWKMVKLRGEISIVAIYGHNADVELTQFVRRQLSIRTSYASSTPNYKTAIELLSSGAIPVDELVAVYPLSNGIQGFKDAEQQSVVKPILNCKA
jgi:L-iditol 2-dehydrogenase